MAYEANESERWKKTESDQLDETAGAQTGEEETQWMNMKRGSKKKNKKNSVHLSFYGALSRPINRLDWPDNRCRRLRSHDINHPPSRLSFALYYSYFLFLIFKIWSVSCPFCWCLPGAIFSWFVCLPRGLGHHHRRLSFRAPLIKTSTRPQLKKKNK